MTPRRYIVLSIILLFLFLGMYTWNQRTGILDKVATHVGLELVASILKPVLTIHGTYSDIWENYVDLVGVREENTRLKADLLSIQSQLIAADENKAEVERLRALLSLPVDRSWRPLGARVLAGRMGPNSVLETVILSRGYVTGSTPGTPIMTNLGLVGRVLRASPHASTALLLTDPSSRIAVLSQKTRTAGILTGHGGRNPLELRFVEHDALIEEGEVLVTSGLDGVYPKGLSVARVTEVSMYGYSPFKTVHAEPLVDAGHLEEVLLLEPTGLEPLPELPHEDFVGPPTEEQWVLLVKKALEEAEAKAEAALQEAAAMGPPKPAQAGAPKPVTSGGQGVSVPPSRVLP